MDFSWKSAILHAIYVRVSASMPVFCTAQGFSENIAVAETNYQMLEVYHVVMGSGLTLLQ